MELYSLTVSVHEREREKEEEEEEEEGASEEIENGWAMRSRASDRGSVSALREEKQKGRK